MGPEDKRKLLSRDPKQRREQERSDVYATNKRLIAESVALRKKAKELQALADELMAKFKDDHPES
jgi:hypothetical protein